MDILHPGTLLNNGNYRIERHLSSGGFGNTYLATDVNLEYRVAIKEFFMRGITHRDGATLEVSVSNESNADLFDKQKDKFRREAKRIHSLTHPHIVRVNALFGENNTWYYAMDYVDGGSLAEWLKKHGAMPEAKVGKYLDQLLDALQTVHKAGMLHLDLKPGNIMLDEASDSIALIDFGASKQMSHADAATTSMSTGLAYTPGYAPSEQMEQKTDAIGPWTDLYAVGATLYTLLTAKQPPQQDDIINEGEGAFHFGNVSPKMKAIILRLMQPARKQRPQSVKELKEIINSGKTAETKETVESKVDEDNIKEETVNEETVKAQELTIPQKKPERIVPQKKGIKVNKKNKTRRFNVFLIFGLALLFGLAIFMVAYNTHKASKPTVESRIMELPDYDDDEKHDILYLKKYDAWDIDSIRSNTFQEFIVQLKVGEYRDFMTHSEYSKLASGNNRDLVNGYYLQVYDRIQALTHCEYLPPNVEVEPAPIYSYNLSDFIKQHCGGNDVIDISLLAESLKNFSENDLLDNAAVEAKAEAAAEVAAEPAADSEVQAPAAEYTEAPAAPAAE